MISETKPDDSFPARQFLIDGYTSLYRLDRSGKGGGILMYVREDIPSKIIPIHFPNTESYFLEINLKKMKWDICCSYNPHNDYISSHMDGMGTGVDLLSHNYDNFSMIGNFNTREADSSVKDFRDIYSFKHLVKEIPCYKILWIQNVSILC